MCDLAHGPLVKIPADTAIIQNDPNRHISDHPNILEFQNIFFFLKKKYATFIQRIGCSKRGVYGNSCNESCPENCQEQRCDIINGSCLGCTPGWIDEYCNKGLINISITSLQL